MVYCHVVAKNCHYCPLKCKKKGLQSVRPSKLLQCRPQSPRPQGDQFPGNDVPGHATRLVATQQPDMVLHFTTSLAGGLCGCAGGLCGARATSSYRAPMALLKRAVLSTHQAHASTPVLWQLISIPGRITSSGRREWPCRWHACGASPVQHAQSTGSVLRPATGPAQTQPPSPPFPHSPTILNTKPQEP